MSVPKVNVLGFLLSLYSLLPPLPCQRKSGFPRSEVNFSKIINTLSEGTFPSSQVVPLKPSTLILRKRLSDILYLFINLNFSVLFLKIICISVR